MCCDSSKAAQEFRSAFGFVGRNFYRYLFNPLTAACGGSSCYTAANQMQDDIESQVSPKCWVTSTQLTTGAVGKLVNAIAGFHFPVHYVVKFAPCSGGGPPMFIDDYLGPDAWTLDPGNVISEP